MKKYYGMICLLAIVILFPMKWYESVIPYVMNPEGVGIFFVSLTGIQIFTYNCFSIFIIYILCLAIQYLVVENQKGYLIAVISKILFILQLMFVPMLILYPSDNREYFFQNLDEYMFPMFRAGFYLTVILVAISMIQNIIGLIQSYRK